MFHISFGSTIQPASQWINDLCKRLCFGAKSLAFTNSTVNQGGKHFKGLLFKAACHPNKNFIHPTDFIRAVHIHKHMSVYIYIYLIICLPVSILWFPMNHRETVGITSTAIEFFSFFSVPKKKRKSTAAWRNSMLRLGV